MRERERERERGNFEVSRDCGAKLWIISSYVEPNNSLYTHTHKKMNTWGKIENFKIFSFNFDNIIYYIIKVGLRSRGCAKWLHQIA